MFGHATSTTGVSHGVRGDTESNHNSAEGVMGWANNSSGTGAGVWGRLLGSSDDCAAGVRGQANATSGNTFGVEGFTSSSSSEAAGVKGDATDSNHGVKGRVYDTESNLGTLTPGESAGVMGSTDEPSGFGVVGWSANYIGVLGRSDTATVAGGTFYNSADGLALDVNGYADVSEVGASAYRPTSQ